MAGSATASFGSDFLLYAKPKTFELLFAEGDTELRHWGSAQFKKLDLGDRLWIVTMPHDQLLLVGPIMVGAITDFKGAAEEMGTDDLWDSVFHVLAPPDTVELARRSHDITDIAPRLRFIGTKDRLPEVFTGQSLQTMRRLTPESALELERTWYKTPGTDPLRQIRRKVLQSISERRGQAKFRRSLLVAYRSQCAVTGCQIESLLEAAHIIPVSEDGSDAESNGLLLRTDIHTLFDLGLLAIDPDNDFRIRIAPVLAADPEYCRFEDKQMDIPAMPAQQPNHEALRLRTAAALRHWTREEREPGLTQ